MVYFFFYSFFYEFLEKKNNNNNNNNNSNSCTNETLNCFYHSGQKIAPVILFIHFVGYNGLLYYTFDINHYFFYALFVLM